MTGQKKVITMSYFSLVGATIIMNLNNLVMYHNSGNFTYLSHHVFLHTTNDNHNNNDDNKDHVYGGCNNRHQNDNYGENTQ